MVGWVQEVEERRKGAGIMEGVVKRQSRDGAGKGGGEGWMRKMGGCEASESARAR